MVRIPSGDYFIDSGSVVERKTYADCATAPSMDGCSRKLRHLREVTSPVVILEGQNRADA